MVSERKLNAAQPDLVREGFGGHSGRLVAHQIFALQMKQLWILAFGLAPPMVEVGTVAQALGDDLVVKGENQLVVDQHVGPPRLVLQRFDVEHQLVIVREERPASCIFLTDLAFDQALADENFTRLLGIHRPEIHPLLRIDDNAVKRRPLEGDDLHGLLFPVWIEPAALDQVRADCLQPFRFDARHAAGKELGGFGDFSRSDPFAGLLVERRTRVDQELHSACAQVVPGILRLAADVAEQAGEQCAMNGVISGGNLVLPVAGPPQGGDFVTLRAQQGCRRPLPGEGGRGVGFS